MHDSHVAYGMPYDFKRKITCPDCIAIIVNFRNELCQQYGWDSWPDDLKGSLEGE